MSEEFDDRPLWEQALSAEPTDAMSRLTALADKIDAQLPTAYADREQLRSFRRTEDRRAADAQGISVEELWAIEADHPVERMDDAVARRGGCSHCAVDPRAYSDGLCRPCHMYLKKFHTLPTSDQLRVRLEKRDARRSALRSYTDR